MVIHASVAGAMNALRRIVRALRVASKASERDLGVGTAQLFVLERLAESPAESIAELSSRTATDQSSVSVVVARLVERGLVSRRVAKTDARRAEIHITKKGRTLLEKSAKKAGDDGAAVQARMIAALSALPKAKLANVSSGFETLVHALGEGEAPATMFFEEDRSRMRRAKPVKTKHVKR